METSENRKPYSPPKISRVILRREQAVLSACSLLATSIYDNNPSPTTMCWTPEVIPPDGCTKVSGFGGDSENLS